MGRLWNKLAREFIFRFKKTGLEQELNVALLSGKLTVPELHAAAREMAAESIVLLKNEKNTLPLDKNETVAVFGRVAVNYFTVGYGSGGDVIPPYRSSLMDGLREKKVKLDEELAETYAKWCATKRNIPDEGYWGHWPMYYEEMPLNDKVVSASAAKAKKAVVVIGRAAGEDRENLLLRSDDNGLSWDTIGGGSQDWRAIGLSFNENSLIWGTDAGSVPDQNHIIRMNRQTKQLQVLDDAEGPCHGCASLRDGRVFISTGVEGGQNEEDRYARLKEIVDGMPLDVLCAEKDSWPLIIQYGVIRFPLGTENTNHLVFTLFALKDNGEQVYVEE